MQKTCLEKIEMEIKELAEFGVPERIVQVLKEEGFEELYPPQEDAVMQGLLDLKSSFVVSVPTASGKTLIAELLMVKSILEGRGKCLYIVPLRALASEKLEDFKKYEKAGIRVAISTGEYDTSDAWLANYDIIVTTSEKADSLLRHRSEWLRDISVLVADEIHLIHDASRGPTLEVTIARLRQLNPNLIILGLSATINNANEIASWLNARLIRSDWRPVPLREGISFNNEIFFSDSKLVEVEHVAKGEPLNLALETVKNKGQSLVFVNTRRGAERFALDACPSTRRFVSKAEGKVLKGLAKEVLETLPEPTRICKRLSKCIESGTAFHHAGLAARQRKIVEEGFKANHIKVLSATPTLAAGVNLPARRVVIRDYTRYEANLGRVEIPVLEYKQMAGRGGRPKYDTYGEALLIAKSFEERSHLLDNYVLAEPETIYSKLAVESALRTHVLATIATGYADSFYGVLEFFSKTFFAYQQASYTLEDLIHRVIDFLLKEGFIKEKGDFIYPTSFGRRTSELYIDPVSAVILRDALFKAQKIKTNELSYLHTISSTPELGSLYLKRKDYDLCTKELYENASFFLFEIPNQLSEPWKFEEFLSEVKTALFLKDWINERSEGFILEKYNLGPGDIRNKIELSDWLLYSMIEVGRLFKLSKMGEVARLKERVKHGIKEELLELVSLRGIGRARARRLFVHGFKTLKDLKKAEIAQISRIELIGKKIAANIKKQLGEEVEIEDEGKDEVEEEYQSQISEF
jgi:helicase